MRAQGNEIKALEGAAVKGSSCLAACPSQRGQGVAMSQCLGTGEALEESREGLPGSTQSPVCSRSTSRWSGCFPLLSADVGVEKRASARPPPAWPLRQGDKWEQRVVVAI